MNETRAPDKDLIKKEYLEGLKQKDICEKHNISINTLKSWIKRYGWSKEKKGAPKNKKGCTSKKVKENSVKKPEFDGVDSTVQDVDLTEKQRLFCIYYVKYRNATKAYQKAYNCDYFTAMASGSRMLRNVKINSEIDRQLEEIRSDLKIDNRDLVQKYIDIAFSDMKDYLEFGSEEIEGEFGSYTRSYINLKNSDEVDGTLISEISQGKDGIKIKLADRMKALDWLDKHIGLASDEQKLKIDKLKAELNKMTNIEDTELTIKVVRASEERRD